MGFVLEYVQPGEHTADDFNWLEMAGNAGPEFQKLPALQVEHWLRQKEMQLFRFKPGPGVVLTEVRRSASGVKRLGIVRAAGEGVGWTFAKVAELLQHTAKEYGCEAVETMVYSPRLAKAMQRIGAKPEAVNMVLEVK